MLEGRSGEGGLVESKGWGFGDRRTGQKSSHLFMSLYGCSWRDVMSSTGSWSPVLHRILGGVVGFQGVGDVRWRCQEAEGGGHGGCGWFGV